MAKLTIIPTPIGNLKDITLRALECIQEVDVLLAEDTRTTGQLFTLLGIKTKQLRSFHMHNEHASSTKIAIAIAAEDLHYGLVSDAGTPGISDPAYLLVKECITAGVQVECLPGATALIPALVVSGLPASSFVFEGFLPQKKGRQKRWKAIALEQRTIVCYESPHRVLKFLNEALEHLGPERILSVSREVSKKFEETIRDFPPALIEHFTNEAPRGEFVITIQGAI